MSNRGVRLYLRLVGEDKVSIIGEDEDGVRRRFARDKVKASLFDRANEAVTIVMAKADAKASPILKNDSTPDKDFERVTRPCLCCKHPHTSHPAIRICGSCKEGAVWGGDTEYSISY